MCECSSRFIVASDDGFACFCVWYMFVSAVFGFVFFFPFRGSITKCSCAIVYVCRFLNCVMRSELLRFVCAMFLKVFACC